MPYNSRVKKQYAGQNARRRSHSADISVEIEETHPENPSIPAIPLRPSHVDIQRNAILVVKNIALRRYYGVGYDGVRHPLVYDDFEEAAAKYTKICKFRKSNPRFNTKPYTFDRATWYSMYGNQSIIVPIRGWQMWQWQAEPAWLKRKEEGTELSTDISGDETSIDETPSQSTASASASSETPSPSATVKKANRSELSRSQQHKKSQKTKAKESSKLSGTYQCADSDREFIEDQGKISFRVPNPRHAYGMHLLRELEENDDPTVKERLKEEFVGYVWQTAHVKTFNPAAADQMTRLVVQMAKEAPLAKPHSAPEEFDISTDGEQEDYSRLDSESNVGRIKKAGKMIAKINADIEVYKDPANHEEQSSTLPPISEIANVDEIADEICTRYALNLSRTALKSGAASSSASAAAGSLAEDTSSDAAIAEAYSEALAADALVTRPQRSTKTKIFLEYTHHLEYKFDFDGIHGKLIDGGSLVPYPRSPQDPMLGLDDPYSAKKNSAFPESMATPVGQVQNPDVAGVHVPVRIDFDPKGPLIQILTRLSAKDEPLGYERFKTVFMEQAKKYNTVNPITGVQKKRLHDIINVLSPQKAAPERHGKYQLWEFLFHVCGGLFLKRDQFTKDVEFKISQAYAAHRELERAKMNSRHIAQAQASTPALVTPSQIYYVAPTPPNATTLSASELSRLGNPVQQVEDDDAQSSISGLSITPSDSASVASTRIASRAAYSLDLSSIKEVPENYLISRVVPLVDPDVVPDRPSGSSGHTDSESEPPPDRILETEYDHGAPRRKGSPMQRQSKRGRHQEKARSPRLPAPPARPVPPYDETIRIKSPISDERAKDPTPFSDDYSSSPSEEDRHPDDEDTLLKYPLENDGAQVLATSKYDNSSSVSRATSTSHISAEIGPDGKKQKFRYMTQQGMIIFSRRRGEPWIDEARHKDVQRCNVCIKPYLIMQISTALQVLDDQEQLNWQKCCSRTCFRNWHSLVLKDEPQGRIVSDGPVPFTAPDSAIEFRNQRRIRERDRAQSARDVEMTDPKPEEGSSEVYYSPITPPGDKSQTLSSSSADSAPSPRLSAYPESPKFQLQAKSAPTGRQRRIQSGKQGHELVRIKHEELILWKELTGDVFKKSLTAAVETLVRSGKRQETVYIQTEVAPNNTKISMFTTYRECINVMIAGGWEFEYGSSLPGYPAHQMRAINLEISNKFATDLAGELPYQRTRSGLSPTGSEQQILTQPEDKVMQAADAVKQFSEWFCKIIWSQKYETTRFEEIFPVKCKFPKLGYLQLANNVLIPIGSDHCKPLDLTVIPFDRFWVIPHITLPPNVDPNEPAQPQWKRSHTSWFERLLHLPDENNGRKISVPCRGWTKFPEGLWWEDPDGRTRGGFRISTMMFNLSETANVFLQLVLLIRYVEGFIFVPVTQEMFQPRGRRKTEALIAEADPDHDPGTVKTAKELSDDLLLGCTEWSLALGAKGDKKLDGTVADVRTTTDPIANPYLDDNFLTENKNYRTRIATGAAGKHDNLCHVICDNADGSAHRFHVSEYNKWFSAMHPDVRRHDGIEIGTTTHMQNAMIHCLIMRCDIIEEHKEMRDLMVKYDRYRPVIEWQKPQYQDAHAAPQWLLDEWNGMSRAEQGKIKQIRKNVRKRSRSTASKCDAMTLLLGGHFNAEQKYVFCAQNRELHFLLCIRPPIWPNLRLTQEINNYVEAHKSHLKWKNRNQISYLWDTRNNTRFNCIDPKNHPEGVEGKKSPVGIAGTAIIYMEELFKGARKKWQRTQNQPIRCDPYSSTFAMIVSEHIRDHWAQCIGGQYRALFCTNCHRHQPNFLEVASRQINAESFECTCPYWTQRWSCKESIAMHDYLNSQIKGFDEAHRNLVAADTTAIVNNLGFLDHEWRTPFENECPELLRAYRTGQACADPQSPTMCDPAYKKPHFHAPNYNLLPGIPFGLAPPIVNSACDIADRKFDLLIEPAALYEFERMLRDYNFISRVENFGDWYQRQCAICEQMLEECQLQLDRWAEINGDSTGNRYLQYAMTLGRPLTHPSDVVTKVVRLSSGRLAVISNVNPALDDERYRNQAMLFTNLRTPMLKDEAEIRHRGLPSEVIFRFIFAWTAAGAPGFHDWWKTPSEFQDTLFSLPAVFRDGRIIESSVPHNLGRAIAQNALENAPPEQTLSDLTSLPRLNNPLYSKEVRNIVTKFYEKRSPDVQKLLDDLQEITREATAHELQAITDTPPEASFTLGIEVHALLHSQSSEAARSEIFHQDNDDTQGRDAVEPELLATAPEFHYTSKGGHFPKIIHDAIYNGSLNGAIPWLFGKDQDGGYVLHFANQFINEYCRRNGVPCIEAYEPSSVLMYADILSKEDVGSRPSPTEWHWPPPTAAPETPLAVTPDAVLVDTKVWIICSPEYSKERATAGDLVYNVFGPETRLWPEYDTLEPFGPNCGSYVPDMRWLFIGYFIGWKWKDLPSWFRPEDEFISYVDTKSGKRHPCTHQPNFGTFLSAYLRVMQDSHTGELGSKISAMQEYAANTRRVETAEDYAS